MNFRYLLLLSLVFTLTCCKPKSNWKISFCTAIENEKCIESNDHFERNIRIFVTLESRTPIKEKLIVGNIYRMLDGNYDDYLGSNNFHIQPETYLINHYIPFDQLGGAGPHLIEFTREDGSLIISKELFIK